MPSQKKKKGLLGGIRSQFGTNPKYKRKPVKKLPPMAASDGERRPSEAGFEEDDAQSEIMAQYHVAVREFNLLDEDSDGLVTQVDQRRLWKSKGQNVGDPDVKARMDQQWKQLDVEDTGRIDLRQFLQALSLEHIYDQVKAAEDNAAAAAAAAEATATAEAAKEVENQKISASSSTDIAKARSKDAAGKEGKRPDKGAAEAQRKGSKDAARTGAQTTGQKAAEAGGSGAGGSGVVPTDLEGAARMFATAMVGFAPTLREGFDRLDGDNDGILSRTEFKLALVTLGITLPDSERKRMRKAMDLTNDKKLTFEEVQGFVERYSGGGGAEAGRQAQSSGGVGDARQDGSPWRSVGGGSGSSAASGAAGAGASAAMQSPATPSTPAKTVSPKPPKKLPSLKKTPGASPTALGGSPYALGGNFGSPAPLSSAQPLLGGGAGAGAAAGDPGDLGDLEL